MPGCLVIFSGPELGPWDGEWEALGLAASTSGREVESLGLFAARQVVTICYSLSSW